MEQHTDVPLGTLKAYGTLSGYIYLHLPQHVCKQFGIFPSTNFSIIYRDGRILLQQDKEKNDATPITSSK